MTDKDRDRDSLQRDLHKFHTDREYLRKLGELALASSLNSLTKNVPISVPSSIDRTQQLCNSDKPPPIPPERDDSSSHFHRSASMVVEKNSRPGTSAADQLQLQQLQQHGASSILTPTSKTLATSKSSKELNYGSVKHRKYATVSEKKHRNSSIETTDLGFVRYEDAAAIMNGRETIRRHYHSAVRKYEGLQEEYDFLHKRYADLVTAHSSVVFKLELAQEDLMRMRKNYEEIVQEKNCALRDRTGLQQQCTAAIRQWDKALRECNEAKDLLAKVQQQRDDAMKEVNQAMTWRIKATKDLARLTEERNEAVNEYSLVMSERDSVHKEIEKLQEELHETQKKLKVSSEEKKNYQFEIDNLKKEVLATVLEKQRLVKENSELKERFSEFIGHSEDAASPTSPSRSSINATPLGLKLWGSSSSVVSTSWTQLSLKNANSDLLKHNHLSASNSSSISTVCSNTKLKLDLEHANQIVELRRQVDRLRHNQMEAQQEVEVFKRRLEWAFSEKEKIALERDSIRYLCDRLRKERDQIVTKLAKALAESDDFKRQRNEAQKEISNLKKKLDTATLLTRSPIKDGGGSGGGHSSVTSSQQDANQQFFLNNISRDSAIDADLHSEFDMDSRESTLKRSSEKRKSTIVSKEVSKLACDNMVGGGATGGSSSSDSNGFGNPADRSSKGVVVGLPDDVIDVIHHRSLKSCSADMRSTANPSPAPEMALYHTIHPKRLISPMHALPLNGHGHQSASTGVQSGVGGYRGEGTNSLEMLASVDTSLPTFLNLNRSQSIRVPSSLAVRSQAIANLSAGSLEKELVPFCPPTSCGDVGGTCRSPKSASSDSCFEPTTRIYSPNNSKQPQSPSNKPKPGVVRPIVIEKDPDNPMTPLGIRIKCDENGTGAIFVTTVEGDSPAARAGLHVGDQLLDICGINMRSRIKYKVAQTVLRQSTTTGDKINMSVQYNPEKFAEIFDINLLDHQQGADDEDVSSGDEESDDDEDCADDESSVMAGSGSTKYKPCLFTNV